VSCTTCKGIGHVYVRPHKARRLAIIVDACPECLIRCEMEYRAHIEPVRCDQSTHVLQMSGFKRGKSMRDASETAKVAA